MLNLIDIKSRMPLLLAVSFSISTYSSALLGDNWGGGWHDGWGWGHMFFGSFMMLLFWGALVVLIVLAVRWMGGASGRGGDEPPQGKRAIEILEERYARGEIDKEEFEERKQLISK